MACLVLVRIGFVVILIYFSFRQRLGNNGLTVLAAEQDEIDLQQHFDQLFGYFSLDQSTSYFSLQLTRKSIRYFDASSYQIVTCWTTNTRLHQHGF